MSISFDPKLSPHSFNKFKVCPRQFMFYKSKIPPIEREESENLIIGLNTHEIIEMYYKSLPDEVTGVKHIRKLANDSLQRFISPQLSNRGIKRMHLLITNFVTFEEERFKKATKKGIPFKPTLYEKNMCSKYFSGIPDMVWDDTIYDFKTDKNVFIWDKYKFQGGIYYEILLHNTNKEHKIKFVFLETLDIKQIGKPNLSVLYNIHNNIMECNKSGYYPPNKEDEMQCGWCGWRLRCDLLDIDFKVNDFCDLKYKTTLLKVII